MSDDLPTLERPENATSGIPIADSGGACPGCPMAPANSTDLIRIRANY
jgi:Fe-S cluster biogenesis protein NfuA